MQKTKEFIPTNRICYYWFSKINKIAFNGQLKKIPIIIEKQNDCWASFNVDRTNGFLYITINDAFKNREEFIEILSHEMVHYYCWTFHGYLGHEKQFLEFKPVLEKHRIILQKAY